MEKEKQTYYDLHREDILKKSKEFYDKNKNIIKARNLMYYYDNQHKWKTYYHNKKKKKKPIDKKIYDELKKIEENKQMEIQDKIFIDKFKKEVLSNELKQLEEQNKQLDNELKKLKIRIWRKNSYIKNRERLKEIRNKITIEPDAKLIIYWND